MPLLLKFNYKLNTIMSIFDSKCCICKTWNSCGKKKLNIFLGCCQWTFFKNKQEFKRVFLKELPVRSQLGHMSQLGHRAALEYLCRVNSLYICTKNELFHEMK